MITYKKDFNLTMKKKSMNKFISITNLKVKDEKDLQKIIDKVINASGCEFVEVYKETNSKQESKDKLNECI